MLPDDVLEQIRDELPCLPGVGSSILEISHRSSAFAAILADTRQRLREILAIPESHEILFLQGGSRLQFSIVPLNFGLPDRSAAYIASGSWSHMAFDEARRLTDADLIWNGSVKNFSNIPDELPSSLVGDWSYCYFASNETIHGVQFRPLPLAGKVPLICDMSSDFLTRPFRVQDFALVFACAQKNAGVAGLTIAIANRDQLREVPARTPGYLNLRSHIDSDNLFNTPPTFAIYVFNLMLKWLLRTFGDLAEVERVNLFKSRLIYDAIDRHPDCYRGHSARAARSSANVTFFLASDSETARFLTGAKEQGMSDLKGHRSLGGVRASLYNALPLSAAHRLADYMDAFATTR